MARHVAFFRNLNVGQRDSPSTEQVLDAFTKAGATDVMSVRSNGTVVFSSSSPARARPSLLVADPPLRLVRRGARAHRPLGARPRRPARGRRGQRRGRALRRSPRLPEVLPWRPEAGRLTVVAADRRHAIAVNDEPRTSYATPVLERLLDLRVTSRGAATVLAVADRLR